LFKGQEVRKTESQKDRKTESRKETPIQRIIIIIQMKRNIVKNPSQSQDNPYNPSL